MAKLTTGCGDVGCTRTFHCNIGKDSPVVDAIGAADELQSSLDMARINCSYVDVIGKIQDKLRFLAGEIAGYVQDKEKLISLDDVSAMENLIEELADIVPSHFVRFNHPGSVFLNEARVRARAFERKIVALGSMRKDVLKYANRLSDLLFVLSYKTELDCEQ